MKGLNHYATAGFLLILWQGCLLRLVHGQVLPDHLLSKFFWDAFPEKVNDVGSKMAAKAKSAEERGDYYALNNPRSYYPEIYAQFYASPQYAAPPPQKRTLDRLGSGLMKRPLDHLGQGLLKRNQHQETDDFPRGKSHEAVAEGKREAVELVKKGLDVLGRGLFKRNDGVSPGRSEVSSALEELSRGLGSGHPTKDVDVEMLIDGLDQLTSGMVKRGLDTVGMGLIKKSLDAFTETGPGNTASWKSPHGDGVDLLRKGLDSLQTTLRKAGWDQDALRMISTGAVNLASWIASHRSSLSLSPALGGTAPSKKTLDRLGTGLMKKDAGIKAPIPDKNEDAKDKATANEDLKRRKKEKYDRFISNNKHKYAEFLARVNAGDAAATNSHMYADLKAAFDDGLHHQRSALGSFEKPSINAPRESHERGSSDFKASQEKRGLDQVGMGLMKKGLDQVGMGLMKKGLDQVGMGLMKKGLDQVGMGLMKKGLDQVGMGLMKKRLDQVGMGLMKRGLDQVGMGLMKRGLDQVGMGLMKKGLDQVGMGLMKRGLDQVGMGVMKKGLDQVGMGLMKKRFDEVGSGLMKKGLDQVGSKLMKKGMDDAGSGIYKKDLDYVGFGIMKKDAQPTDSKDVHRPSAAQFRSKQQRHFKSRSTQHNRWPEEPLSQDKPQEKKEYFEAFQTALQ